MRLESIFISGAAAAAHVGLAEWSLTSWLKPAVPDARAVAQRLLRLLGSSKA